MTKFNVFSKSTVAGNSLSAYKAKRKLVSVITSVARYLFLIAFSYILLYPILYMASHAVRDPLFYMDPTVVWIPKAYSLVQFKNAWEVLKMPGTFINSLTVSVGAALLSIVSCGVAAYGLACFDFRGKGILNALLIMLILVPVSMTLIPNYVNYYNFDVLGIFSLIEKIFGVELNTNILDTYWAVYLPAITAVGLKSGLCIYIYRQFYRALPKELFEAAWIDGAGPIKTYVSIVVPSSSVAVLTVSLLSIIWNWNDYYTPQMFLPNKATMTMLINDYFYRNVEAWDTTVTVDSFLAACLMFIAPTLIMYLILQKKFISSVAATGIVG